jgi:hypothetical protein
MTQPKVEAALDVALSMWRKALNDPSIPRPTLKIAGCTGLETIACADASKNEIYWGNAEVDKEDLPSVMMHEIGHILGVPHIAGDPLMDPIYRSKVDKPSVDAVAIAKVHRKGAK